MRHNEGKGSRRGRGTNKCGARSERSDSAGDARDRYGDRYGGDRYGDSRRSSSNDDRLEEYEREVTVLRTQNGFLEKQLAGCMQELELHKRHGREFKMMLDMFNLGSVPDDVIALAMPPAWPGAQRHRHDMADGATLAVLGGPLDTGEPGAMRWAGGGNLAGFRAFATDLAGRGGGGLRGEAGAAIAMIMKGWAKPKPTGSG